MKYFIVVGGSKGIGREFIKKTIKNKNNKIFLISRGDIDISSSSVTHIKTDLRSEKEIKKALKAIKKLSSKIDGIVFSQKYRSVSKSLREELNVNVEATKTIIDLSLEMFCKKSLKSIVVIGSIASKFVALEQPVDYHISKSALVGLVNYYAVTLGKYNININMLSPSTTIKDENINFYKENKELYDLYSSISPVNSVLQSNNISDVITYFLSKKSKFITGQNIVIDGGISLQWQEEVARRFGFNSNIKVTQ